MLKERLATTTRCLAISARRTSHRISKLLSQWKREIECILVPMLLVCFFFYDVLVRRTSLRLIDQIFGSSSGAELIEPFPVPGSPGWWERFSDNGGSVFQSEPMAMFVANSLRLGQSIYWNPFSAAGSLGPEAMVDVKLSPLTLITAIFGASSMAYNVTMLIFLTMATIAIYSVARRMLYLAWYSATAMAVFYLMNGYAVATLGANFAQSYLFAPVALIAGMWWLKKSTVSRFILFVIALTSLLSCTFLPTTITTLCAVFAVLTFFLFTVRPQHLGFWRRTGSVLLLLAAPVTALFIVAPIYIPFLDSLMSTGTLDQYLTRGYAPLRFPNSVTAFLTTGGFYGSYNGTDAAALVSGYTGNTVYHFGLAAILCGIIAVTQRGRLGSNKVLIIGLAGLSVFVVLRLFDTIPFFNKLPVFGNIGAQYWWPLLFLLFTILVGIGVEALLGGRARLWVIAMSLFFLSFLNFLVSKDFATPAPGISNRVISWAVLIGVAVMILVLALLARRNTTSPPGRRRQANKSILALLVLGVLILELLLNARVVRYTRNDPLVDPSGVALFLQSNTGMYRTLTIGDFKYFDELGSAFGVREASALNEGTLAEFDDYFFDTFKATPDNQFLYDPRSGHGTYPTLRMMKDRPEDLQINTHQLGMLGVKYIVLPPSYVNFQKSLTERGFALVYLGPDAIVLESPYLIPRAFTVTDQEFLGISDNEVSVMADSAKVEQNISAYENTHIVISGSTLTGGLVVFTDMWNENWRAYVNGRQVSLLRVDGAFRGIEVPSGSFEIKMEYEPGGLVTGEILSVSTVTGLLAVLVISQIRLRRRRVEKVSI